MPNPEMAVAVAKDVLEQLRDGTIHVGTDYSYLATKFVTDLSEGDLQDVLPEIIESGCTVCALGAVLLSKARLFNDIPLNKVCEATYHPFKRFIRPKRVDIITVLKDVFSETNLDEIEAAFELRNSRSGYYPASIHRAILFGRQFESPQRRLAAIMQNVIDNHGEFVPNNSRESNA